MGWAGFCLVYVILPCLLFRKILSFLLVALVFLSLTCLPPGLQISDWQIVQRAHARLLSPAISGYLTISASV